VREPLIEYEFWEAIARLNVSVRLKLDILIKNNRAKANGCLRPSWGNVKVNIKETRLISNSDFPL
jgi:hypothetical protein